MDAAQPKVTGQRARKGGMSAKDERGFTTILWRRGALGYALVSDIDRRELTSLAAKFRAAP